MKRSDKWRFVFFGVLIIACFAVLTVALANLQIRGGDEYGETAASSMTKTISEAGTRGQILDVNGALLAYDKKIYNVQFYRDPTSDRDKNGEYSRAIWEVIQLVEAEGKTVSFPFWLGLNENGEWEFQTGSEDEGVQAAREKMFRSNFYVKDKPIEEIFDKLCDNYLINDIDKDYPENEKLTFEDKLLVLGVWQEMQMNAFNSQPIVLAKDIKWATVIEIETRLISLSGISVGVENQRVYPKGTLACHVLGYTGLMQSQAQIDEYVGKGYLRSDSIGLDGVEKSMEEWLTPNSATRRGYTVVEVDRTGKRIREMSKQEPSNGNTVKLTIDSSMQQVAEDALSSLITTIRDTEEKLLKDGEWLQQNREELLQYQADEQQLRLAQNGAVVVLDMDARVLAMASFPNYDPNLFILGMDEEQRYRMLQDERKPLLNNAIKAKDTPGSVFKMATALAALYNGAITVNETISDEGVFDKYDTVNPPQCWIAPGLRSRHANLNVEGALKNSCNYYFYTIASRMGDGDGEALYEYSAKLGLTSKTNVQLPGEEKSVVGSQATLYDPTKPINGADQGTWYPVQVKARLKEHLQMIGELYGITYSDDRLDKCIKALMDMAVYHDQGPKQQNWVERIRPILMEELGMTMEMVYRQIVIGDIVNYLNEIKWGGTYTIQTAIGQAITLITPVAMARYIVAIANGGYVYDVQLIDSIISPTGEVLQSFDEPVLVADLSGEIGEYLPYIRNGMKGVVDDGGTAQKYFKDWDHTQDIGGKTGTAEKSKIDVESNSWFVAFAPVDDPEIAVVIYVPYGYSGAMSSQAAIPILDHYYNSKVDDIALILPAPNALVQ